MFGAQITLFHIFWQLLELKCEYVSTERPHFDLTPKDPFHAFCNNLSTSYVRSESIDGTHTLLLYMSAPPPGNKPGNIAINTQKTDPLLNC